MKKIRGQINTKKTQILLILVSFFAILISASCVSAASTVYVNTTGSDSNLGTIDSPFLTIEKGVNNITEGDTVIIANGNYSGVGNTNISIGKNMTITGQSQNHTVINGTGTNWIFNITSGVTVTIQDLTIVSGNETYGGAIENNAGCTLTVNNCTFTDNNAADGGAIENKGTLTVNDSTFTGNKASYGGGAIDGTILTVNNCTFADNNAGAEGGAIQSWNTLTVTGSTFTGNYAGSYGDAIFNWLNCNVTNCTFTSNKANYEGGAIYNNNEGILNVTSSTFTDNNATDGGAIYNYAGTLNVTSSTFTGNNATNYGGAIYNTGTLNVTSSTFTDDNATTEDGGAIYNEGGTSTTPVTISGSTFTGNNATDAAGAIENWNGYLNVADCTFTGNNVTNNSGGAILNSGTLTVTGGTFTGNTAYNGGAISNEGTLNVKSITFTDNTAHNNGGAIWNYNGGTLTANFNRIINNTANQGSAIFNVSGTINAEFNWWGDNNGPAGKINGLTVSKWLILTVIAPPTTINTGSTSQITADLTHDNTGIYHAPEFGHAPNGIPVSFTTTLGSIPNTLTSNGAAVATLNAGSTPGIAVVKAAVDNQTVTANVNINSQWKLVPYTYPVYVPVLKWYKSHGKWKYYYVKVWTKKWHLSDGKWKYHWFKVKKYRTEYRTGQRWELA